MTNEQAKQKAIQEAYGQHWDKVKNLVDPQGWLQEVYYSCSALGFGAYGADDVDFIGIRHVWRPASLRGIEGNNGWTRIETVNDLPKEKGRYEFLTRGRNRVIDNCFTTTEAELAAVKHMYTHWRKIEDVPLPIY